MNDQKQCKDINITKKILYSESIWLFISVMFFVFAPLEIYLSMKEDFFFNGYEILPYALAFGVAAFVLASILTIFGFKFCPKITSKLMIITFFLGSAFYIQGNFVLTSYGVMDGTPVDWSAYTKEGILSNGLFVIAVIAAILIIWCFGYNKVADKLSLISVCVVLVQIITIVTLLIQTGGFGKDEVSINTTRNEFNYSKNQNIIVLLLDTFDAALMEELIKGEDGEAYKKVVEDFTFYPDTLGMYSATDFAIPQILSGEQYKNDVQYGQYVDKAFQNSPLLKDLEEKQWDAGIYSVQIMPTKDKVPNIENIEMVELTVSSHKRLMMYMYRFVGYRYAPQALKQTFWFYPDDMLQMMSIKNDDGSDNEVFSWNNVEFYNHINDMRVEKDRNSFHFYHLEGTHTPFNLLPDMSYSSKETGIESEAAAMMTLIDSFLTNLKEIGAYDNSAIIIMADHGYYNYKQNPVLMIKGMGEEHSFEVSEQKVSYEDLQNIFSDLMNQKQTKELHISTNEIRKFYRYDDSNLGLNSRSEDIVEYETESHASNVEKLRQTGIVYAR